MLTPQPPVHISTVAFVIRENVEMKREGREAEDNQVGIWLILSHLDFSFIMLVNSFTSISFLNMNYIAQYSLVSSHLIGCSFSESSAGPSPLPLNVRAPQDSVFGALIFFHSFSDLI